MGIAEPKIFSYLQIKSQVLQLTGYVYNSGDIGDYLLAVFRRCYGHESNVENVGLDLGYLKWKRPVSTSDSFSILYNLGRYDFKMIGATGLAQSKISWQRTKYISESLSIRTFGGI